MAQFGDIKTISNSEKRKNWMKDHPLTNEQKLNKAKKTKEWREKHLGYDQARWIARTTIESREQKEERLKYGREYKKTHPESKQKSIKWKEKNPQSNRESAWRQLGIEWSYDKWLKMFESQNKKCLGCGCIMVKSRKEITDGKRLAHLDHDHITGKIRGILCSHCNHALGGALDNPTTLRTLADYIESNKNEP